MRDPEWTQKDQERADKDLQEIRRKYPNDPAVREGIEWEKRQAERDKTEKQTNSPRK